MKKKSNKSTSSSPSLQTTTTTTATTTKTTALTSNNEISSPSSWINQVSMDITSDGQLMIVGGGGNGDVGTGLVIEGSLLLSQLFYNKPIKKIKVKTTPIIPSNQGFEAYTTQELTILYQDNIIASISGVSLNNVLQVCYSQSLKGESASGGGGGNNSLSYRKWSLSNQVSKINDFTYCGGFLGSPFRALPYSTTEQSISRLVIAGRDPILSFYYPSDDGGSSFSVLVSSVASRLTSAVFSFAKNWWSGTSNQQQQQQQQQSQLQQQQQQIDIEKAVPLSKRWQISDSKREIQSISIDPTGRFAVTTDNLGRVILLDLVNTLLIRMWKGYRDIQTGWISSNSFQNSFEDDEDDNDDNGDNNEDTTTTTTTANDLLDFIPKKLLKQQQQNTFNISNYLVIYNGRRGFLEIWGLKHRSREYFKSIGKGWKLISTSLPFIQNNNNNRQQPQSSSLSSSSILNSTKCLSHCYLINEKGVLLKIKPPQNNNFQQFQI
eukprot:gene2154-2653_t